MNKKGNILVPIFAAIAVLALMTAGYFFYSAFVKTPADKQTQEQSSNINLPTPAPTVTQDETTNWKTYSSEKFGFEFKYPSNLTIKESESGPGPASTGYKFSVYLYQGEQYADFEMGGVTSDYSAGRGGMLTDTQGFVEKNGEFYCTFIDHVSLLENDVDANKLKNKQGVELLIINGKTRPQTEAENMGMYYCSNPGPEYSLVLINLKGVKYKGLGITIKNDFSIISKKQFDHILSTFKFLE